MVAEGQGTEYDYLDHLNRAFGPDLGFLIGVPSQRRGLSASQVVDQACRAVGDPDLERDEVWALFDHDGRRDIDEVIARARRHGVQATLSHPSFELWLLLHFQDFAPAAQHGSNLVIMKKLRAAHDAFAEYDDGDKRITDRRFDALQQNDGIGKAVGRARQLSGNFTSSAPSGRDPSTDMHLLIEQLGIVR